MEWLGLAGLTAKDYFLAMPWVFLALGRLVPWSRVKEVWTLYYKSEETRGRAVDALEGATSAMEDMVKVNAQMVAKVTELVDIVNRESTS